MLTFPNKAIRSKIIGNYFRSTYYRGIVAFSCGNATKALKALGLPVVAISPGGDLSPTDHWWTPAEIRRVFPDYLDATSGHLPLFLMEEISLAFKDHLGSLKDQAYDIPTGSGETIVCLKLAYPNIDFTAVYNLGDPTRYNPQAPLNGLVARLFKIKGL